MRCPILVMGRMNSSDPRDISYTDCLQAECAWWEVKGGRCCIPQLGRFLQDIARVIDSVYALQKEGKRQ